MELGIGEIWRSGSHVRELGQRAVIFPQEVAEEDGAPTQNFSKLLELS